MESGHSCGGCWVDGGAVECGVGDGGVESCGWGGGCVDGVDDGDDAFLLGESGIGCVVQQTSDEGENAREYACY